MTDITQHLTNLNNPHQTTKAQVGLGNVNNYQTATLEEGLDNTITNKFIVPQVLQHAIDAAIEPADVNKQGVVKVNNGVFSNDDIDQVKALSAKGLINLLNNTSGAFNKIQQSVASLIKQHIYTVNNVSGTANVIMLSITPNAAIDAVSGIIRFKAVFNNTSSTTITTGGLTLPITHWNGQSLSSGNILKDVTYALLPLSDSLILLNPSNLGESAAAAVNARLSQLLEQNDPFPTYTKTEEVVDIVNNSFKGSYVGTATLNDNTYSLTLPTVILTTGIFAIKFNLPNPNSVTLTINNINKPIKYLDSSPITSNEITVSEVRILVNTPNAYLLLATRGNVTQSDSTALLEAHVTDQDPHPLYLNDSRAATKINSAITQHMTDNHTLATTTKNGLLSVSDKIKLNNTTGTNSGDETSSSILNKLSSDVIDIGIL